MLTAKQPCGQTLGGKVLGKEPESLKTAPPRKTATRSDKTRRHPHRNRTPGARSRQSRSLCSQLLLKGIAWAHLQVSLLRWLGSQLGSRASVDGLRQYDAGRGPWWGCQASKRDLQEAPRHKNQQAADLGLAVRRTSRSKAQAVPECSMPCARGGARLKLLCLR